MHIAICVRSYVLIAINGQVLQNEYRTFIKPIHSKVKAVMKAFNGMNDAVKASKLIEGSDGVLTKLQQQLDYAHATTAITLGASCCLLLMYSMRYLVVRHIICTYGICLAYCSSCYRMSAALQKVP